jgi:hypothetical protein
LNLKVLPFKPENDQLFMGISSISVFSIGFLFDEFGGFLKLNLNVEI